jgi:hypothetical protein
MEIGTISLMFAISKPADLNYKAQGGQLYRAFHFRKGSLIGRKETISAMMLQHARRNHLQLIVEHVLDTNAGKQLS